MIYQIDFTLLPDLSKSKIRYALGENTLAALGNLPQFLERAENATRFCWFVDSVGSVLHLDEPELIRLRQGFLRAALSEFVSMKDVLKHEIVELGIPKEIISITSSRNPLLHVIHELRNFELHLHSSRLNPNKISVLFNRKTEPEILHKIELQAWIVDDITLNEFSKLNNAKLYTPTDLENMVKWFNFAQYQWGVHYLVFLAVEQFCNEVIQFYSLGNREKTSA